MVIAFGRDRYRYLTGIRLVLLNPGAYTSGNMKHSLSLVIKCLLVIGSQ